MTDFEFRDTPALEVLRRLPAAPEGLDPADIAAAQGLLRLAKRLLGHFGEAFAVHGLSPGRYAVLMSLFAGEGSLAPSEIADRLGVTRATVTGLIAGLARDGLVAETSGAAADRRRKALSLTAKGRDLLGRVAPDIFDQMAGLFAPLADDERAVLLRLARKVEVGLSHGPEARS